ncbi:MAG: hypothetical protein CMP23_11295 [Rickettsiales bacterium]|nr:hypothetical protein [Rickettsiales bacterium]|tara:strand:- start:3909 stop:4382 length:474 start_codon:yes stop_codon:yes gene_type:complete
MSVLNSTRSVLLVGTLVALVAVLVEGLVVSETERIEQQLDAFTAAFSAGDRAAIEELLSEDFHFRGPRPVGEGNYQQALARLDDFWLQVTGPAANWRSRELRVAGAVGKLELQGTVRFGYSGSLVIYRLDAVFVFQRIGDQWLLAKLDVQGLRPGMF